MQSKKIIILGANGMLGHDLAEIFEDYKSILLDISDLDITDKQAVAEKLNDLKPDVVINAAAYTDVDGAEDDKEIVFKVNAEAVGYLAQACNDIKAILVHFSTEYVFNGKNEQGYREDDEVSPINVYGQSKAKGEELIKEKCDKYYILRSSWLYGHALQVGKPRGLNFVDTMLKLAQEKDELSVVNDQFGKPTFTNDLAQVTKQIIEDENLFGIYHVTNNGECSWYDFAKEIFKIKNINIKLNPIGSETYPLPTPRPKYGVLQNTKLKPLQSWQEALKKYLK